MQRYSTLLGLSFTIILFIFFIVFLVSYQTRIKKKALKNLIPLTFIFILYNLLNLNVNICAIQSSAADYLCMTIIILPVSYTSYFIYRLTKNQQNIGFLPATLFIGFAPITIILLVTFHHPNIENQEIINYLLISIPVILSVLITTLTYFYQGIPRYVQVGTAIFSTILLIYSIVLFFVIDDCGNLFQIGIVNLNYLLLMIFTLIVIKRSMAIDQKNNIHPSKIKSSTLIAFKMHRLTKRQTEIAQYILEGKSYSEIAEDCFLALNTVTKHASNIYKKLDVKGKKSFIEKFS